MVMMVIVFGAALLFGISVYSIAKSNAATRRRHEQLAWEAHQRKQHEAWRHHQAAQEAARQGAIRAEFARQEAEAQRQAEQAKERFRQERAALQVKRERRALEIAGPNGPTRLREERIEVGDTSEFVLLVLGEPHSRAEKATASMLIETWKWMDGRRIARQIRLKNGIVTTVDVRD